MCENNMENESVRSEMNAIFVKKENKQFVLRNVERFIGELWEEEFFIIEDMKILII